MLGLNYRLLFLGKMQKTHYTLFFWLITTKRNPIQSEFPVACLFFLLYILAGGARESSKLTIPVYGAKNTQNLFIKNCVFILMCLNLSHLQSTLPFEAKHLLRYFFPLLKTVFELIDFDAIQCFCCFLFHLFHRAKRFPLSTFFIQGNKKSHLR